MENFEPLYHVPQQSRRDKLRVQLQSNSSTNLVLPFNYHEDKTLNYVLMDPQSSIIPFQEITSNPFLYSHQRFLEQPFDNNNNIITTCQGLSLSLSSHNYNTTNYQISSSSHVPLGPFTGYALILKGSRFLKPAQMLLEEICHDEDIKGIYGEKLEGDDDLEMMDPSLEATISDDGSEHRRKKSKLIYMLDEVCKRYKQYYQQLQAVVASFESVPGLGNAAPFANLSLKALSKHFKGLKNSITDQLQYTGKSQNCESDSIPRVGTYPGKGHFGQKSAIHNAGFVDHHQPVWRPQRGLPERAVTVLRAWLFDHFLHPYPTDSDKVMLAKQTGLSRNQVSNWFINARVRLWKPMVEEIHMLETKQAHKTSSQRDQVQNNNPSLASENPSTSTQQFQDVSFKRTRNNNHPTDQTQGMNFSRPSRVETSGTTGVSLTLGLHQNNNNGLGLSSDQSFPRNAARRFGIDANNEGFMFGNFDQQAQNRQLAGREIIGGQMLHDFVG